MLSLSISLSSVGCSLGHPILFWQTEIREALERYPLGHEPRDLPLPEWGIERCHAAVQRGCNATLVALFDPRHMSEGEEVTHERDYEEFVVNSRRSWWATFYQQEARLKHILSFVRRDIENIVGTRIG